MADEHDMLLSQNGTEWEVGCTCGWDSPSSWGVADPAIDAWENHCDVTFMEATGG